MRLALFGLTLLVLLPQLRVLFEREGWPDMVVLIDDSKSMGHVDEDPPPKPSPAPGGGQGGSKSARLALVQSFLTRNNAAWLEELIAGRQVKLHVYRCSERAERIAELESRDPGSIKDVINGLQAAGRSSRLGSAVESVLQEFRGSSLAGIVYFTDGVTTDGDDLPAAAQQAARSGVPLYPIGVGDAREPRDLVLHDLQVDDAVHVQDRLVFDARLTARGSLRAGSIPVSLLEWQGDQWKLIKRETVQLDTSGKPTRVRIAHAPTQPGERRFALEVPVQPDESDPTNNRLEAHHLCRGGSANAGALH